MTGRIDALMAKAAEEFDEMRSPFTPGWLAENHVTLDECLDLSLAVANALRAYPRLPLSLRVQYSLEAAGEM